MDKTRGLVYEQAKAKMNFTPFADPTTGNEPTSYVLLAKNNGKGAFMCLNPGDYTDPWSSVKQLMSPDTVSGGTGHLTAADIGFLPLVGGWDFDKPPGSYGSMVPLMSVSEYQSQIITTDRRAGVVDVVDCLGMSPILTSSKAVRYAGSMNHSDVRTAPLQGAQLVCWNDQYDSVIMGDFDVDDVDHNAVNLRLNVDAKTVALASGQGTFTISDVTTDTTTGGIPDWYDGPVRVQGSVTIDTTHKFATDVTWEVELSFSGTYVNMADGKVYSYDNITTKTQGDTYIITMPNMATNEIILEVDHQFVNPEQNTDFGKWLPKLVSIDLIVSSKTLTHSMSQPTHDTDMMLPTAALNTIVGDIELLFVSNGSDVLPFSEPFHAAMINVPGTSEGKLGTLTMFNRIAYGVRPDSKETENLLGNRIRPPMSTSQRDRAQAALRKAFGRYLGMTTLRSENVGYDYFRDYSADLHRLVRYITQANRGTASLAQAMIDVDRGRGPSLESAAQYLANEEILGPLTGHNAGSSIWHRGIGHALRSLSKRAGRALRPVGRALKKTFTDPALLSELASTLPEFLADERYLPQDEKELNDFDSYFSDTGREELVRQTSIDYDPPKDFPPPVLVSMNQLEGKMSPLREDIDYDIPDEHHFYAMAKKKKIFQNVKGKLLRVYKQVISDLPKISGELKVDLESKQPFKASLNFNGQVLRVPDLARPRRKRSRSILDRVFKNADLKTTESQTPSVRTNSPDKRKFLAMETTSEHKGNKSSTADCGCIFIGHHPLSTIGFLPWSWHDNKGNARNYTASDVEPASSQDIVPRQQSQKPTDQSGLREIEDLFSSLGVQAPADVKESSRPSLQTGSKSRKLKSSAKAFTSRKGKHKQTTAKRETKTQRATWKPVQKDAEQEAIQHQKTQEVKENYYLPAIQFTRAYDAEAAQRSADLTRKSHSPQEIGLTLYNTPGLHKLVSQCASVTSNTYFGSGGSETMATTAGFAAVTEGAESMALFQITLTFVPINPPDISYYKFSKSVEGAISTYSHRTPNYFATYFVSSAFTVDEARRLAETIGQLTHYYKMPPWQNLSVENGDTSTIYVNLHSMHSNVRMKKDMVSQSSYGLALLCALTAKPFIFVSSSVLHVKTKLNEEGQAQRYLEIESPGSLRAKISALYNPRGQHLSEDQIHGGAATQPAISVPFLGNLSADDTMTAFADNIANTRIGPSVWAKNTGTRVKRPQWLKDIKTEQDINDFVAYMFPILATLVNPKTSKPLMNSAVRGNAKKLLQAFLSKANARREHNSLKTAEFRFAKALNLYKATAASYTATQDANQKLVIMQDLKAQHRELGALAQRKLALTRDLMDLRHSRGKYAISSRRSGPLDQAICELVTKNQNLPKKPSNPQLQAYMLGQVSKDATRSGDYTAFNMFTEHARQSRASKFFDLDWVPWKAFNMKSKSGEVTDIARSDYEFFKNLGMTYNSRDSKNQFGPVVFITDSLTQWKKAKNAWSRMMARFAPRNVLRENKEDPQYVISLFRAYGGQNAFGSENPLQQGPTMELLTLGSAIDGELLSKHKLQSKNSKFLELPLYYLSQLKYDFYVRVNTDLTGGVATMVDIPTSSGRMVKKKINKAKMDVFLMPRLVSYEADLARTCKVRFKEAEMSDEKLWEKLNELTVDTGQSDVPSLENPELLEKIND